MPLAYCKQQHVVPLRRRFLRINQKAVMNGFRIVLDFNLVKSALRSLVELRDAAFAHDQWIVRVGINRHLSAVVTLYC